jgi:hypothetical protein
LLEILDEMLSCFKEYLAYEENNPRLIDAMLKDPAPVRFLEERNSAELKAFHNKENLNNSNDEVQWQLPTVVENYDRTIRYLNIFRFLLNSKTFFAGMIDRYDIMYVLVKLTMSKSPFVSILSGLTLSSSVSHFSQNEDKLETSNRKLLVNGVCCRRIINN